MSRNAPNDLEALQTLNSNLASESFFSAASKLVDIRPNTDSLRTQKRIYEEIKSNHAKKIGYSDCEKALGLIQSLDLLLDGTINSQYSLGFFTTKINELFKKESTPNQQRDNLRIAAKMLTKLSQSGLHLKHLTSENQKILQTAIRTILQNLEKVLAATKEGEYYALSMTNLSCKILSHVKNLGLLPLCGKNFFSHIARICDVEDLDDVATNSLCNIATNYEQVARQKLPDDFRRTISQLHPQSNIRTSETQKQIFDNLTTYLRYGDKASKAASAEWKHQPYRGEKRDFIRNIDGRYYVALEYPIDDLAENFADIVIFRKSEDGQRDEIVAILEVDGPHHYCNIDGRRIPNGRTIERDKLRTTLRVPFVKIEEGQLQNFGAETAAIAAAAFSQIAAIARIRTELASLETEDAPPATSVDSAAVSLPPELSDSAAAVMVGGAAAPISTQPLTQTTSPKALASSAGAAAAKSGAKKEKLSKSKKDLLAILNNPEFDFDLLKNFLKKHPYAANLDLYRQPIILRGALEYGGGYVNLVEYAVLLPHVNLFLFLLRCLPSEVIKSQKLLHLIGPNNAAIALIMKKAGLLEGKNLESNQFVVRYLTRFAADCAKIKSLSVSDSRDFLDTLAADLKSQDWKTEAILRNIAACKGLNLMIALETVAPYATELLQFALLGVTPDSLKQDIDEDRKPHRAGTVKGTALYKIGQKVDEKSGMIYPSLLSMAVKRLDYDQIDFLLELGVDINSGDEFCKTALITAVIMNDLAMVKYLVEKCKADVNFVDARSFTALEEASARGYLEILQYLLYNKVTPKMRKDGNYLPYDALLAAAVNGKIESLKVFFANGYRADYVGVMGDSLLSTAVYNNDANVIKFLLPLGAAINYPAEKRNEDKFFEYKDQKDGCNIFLKICCFGNRETLASFQPPYQFTSDQMHASDLKGNNAFHLACFFGNDIVKDIFQNFVDSFGIAEAQKMLVARNNSEKNFLDIALEEFNSEMRNFFFEKFSVEDLSHLPGFPLYFLDACLQNGFGKDEERSRKKAQEIIDFHRGFVNTPIEIPGMGYATPLHAAVFRYKNKDMVELLCENGADLELESDLGRGKCKVAARLNSGGYNGEEFDGIKEVLQRFSNTTAASAAVVRPEGSAFAHQQTDVERL